MSRLISKRNNTERRQNRVRTAVRGSSARPRLSVSVSNRHVSAQIIDDSKSVTLAGVSTAAKISKASMAKGTLTEQAAWTGSEIAKQAKAKKIKKIAFDRGSHRYHGRVKALADAARAEGLEF